MKGSRKSEGGGSGTDAEKLRKEHQAGKLGGGGQSTARQGHAAQSGSPHSRQAGCLLGQEVGRGWV